MTISCSSDRSAPRIVIWIATLSPLRGVAARIARNALAIIIAHRAKPCRHLGDLSITSPLRKNPVTRLTSYELFEVRTD